VECPICGDAFDPAVAGGWCTNPDCGEWQYDGDVEASVDTTEETGDEYNDLLSEAATQSDSSNRTDAEDGTDAAPSDVGDGAASVDDETTEAARESQTPLEKSGEGQTDSAAGENQETAEDVADERPADEAEADEVVADESSDVAEETDDETSAVDAADSETDSPTIECPDCGVDLDADANFCVECGADVQDIDPGEPEPLTECPSCDAPVDDGDSFCASCGENLDAHRGSESNEEISEDTANADDDADDAVEALKAQSETDDEDTPVPDTLVLEVRGREIDVEDGDHVGREVRAALTDAGRPEDEAVRVHREHVRFVRESDAFYLVDLGDNPTRLNGQPLEKGDREPVADGDELELSGVATATIRVP